MLVLCTLKRGAFWLVLHKHRAGIRTPPTRPVGLGPHLGGHATQQRAGHASLVQAQPGEERLGLEKGAHS